MQRMYIYIYIYIIHSDPVVIQTVLNRQVNGAWYNWINDTWISLLHLLLGNNESICEREIQVSLLVYIYFIYIHNELFGDK